MSTDNQFSIMVEEFKLLRAEIESRIESQQQIIKFSLILLSLSAGIVAFFSGKVTNPRIVYLVISYIFGSFMFMFLDHDMMVATIGLYIDKKLRPGIEELIRGGTKNEVHVLEWEEYRGEIHHKNKTILPFIAITSASRYGILIVPCLVSIFLYAFERKKTASIPMIENMLFYAALVMIILIILSSITNSRLYTHSIDEKRPKVRKKQ